MKNTRWTVLTVVALTSVAAFTMFAGCDDTADTDAPSPAVVNDHDQAGHEGHDHATHMQDAAEGAVADAEQAVAQAAAEVETIQQEKCPIMNAPINKELYTVYQGKKVYFCCAGCEDTFKKDPEKYLSKLPQFDEDAEQ